MRSAILIAAAAALPAGCYHLKTEPDNYRIDCNVPNAKIFVYDDDADKEELPRLCCGKAADAFLTLLAEGHPFAQQPGASEAIATDCLRRADRGADWPYPSLREL